MMIRRIHLHRCSPSVSRLLGAVQVFALPGRWLQWLEPQISLCFPLFFFVEPLCCVASIFGFRACGWQWLAKTLSWNLIALASHQLEFDLISFSSYGLWDVFKAYCCAFLSQSLRSGCRIRVIPGAEMVTCCWINCGNYWIL